MHLIHHRQKGSAPRRNTNNFPRAQSRHQEVSRSSANRRLYRFIGVALRLSNYRLSQSKLFLQDVFQLNEGAGRANHRCPNNLFLFSPLQKT
jgi:hypothetical protein